MQLSSPSAGPGNGVCEREAHVELPMIAQRPMLRAISALPSTAVAIDIQHAHTTATVETTRQAQIGLTAVTDAVMEQIEQTCRERLLLVELYRRQITAWRRIALHAAETAETDRLDTTLDAETAIVGEVLAIAKEISGRTVERVGSKSALEMHLETLLRIVPEQRPYMVRPHYRRIQTSLSSER